MLGSNNYLGLTTDPRVKKGAMDAVARYGTGVTGSRLLNGTLPLHTELEELLADWVGMEKALVFTTGYTANLGLISTLVQDGDAVFCDSAAHASLVDGARLAEGTLRAFFHNRPNSLRRGLRSWRSQPDAGGVLVAVDGIYSMEGDWAPLAEIRGLCDEYDARLLVDEAHALGVVGPHGAGTSAATGVRADLIMGTFSKSLASCGGFIAGPADVIGFLRLFCRPILFTASNVPASLGAACWRRPRSPGRKTGAGRSSCAWPGGCATGWTTSATAWAATPGVPSCPFISMTWWERGCSGRPCSTGASTPTARSRRPCRAPCCGRRSWLLIPMPTSTVPSTSSPRWPATASSTPRGSECWRCCSSGSRASPARCPDWSGALTGLVH